MAETPDVLSHTGLSAVFDALLALVMGPVRTAVTPGPEGGFLLARLIDSIPGPLYASRFHPVVADALINTLDDQPTPWWSALVKAIKSKPESSSVPCVAGLL